MTSTDKTIKNARRAVRNAKSAADTSADGQEMMRAASDVVAARMEIMADGMANPGRADLKEMSLMSTEKVEAFSASASAVAQTLGDVGDRLTRNSLSEFTLASKAATDFAAARTPMAAASVQLNYAMGWWGRQAGQMLTLNTELIKAQADALKPIHKAAVDNAKRLKK